jgi:acyl-coenzyme A thioesterase PaaI-like protein
VALTNVQVACRTDVQHGEPMTDLLGGDVSVPGRLGVSSEYSDGEFTLSLRPRPEVLRQGVVRASVVSFMIDVVAGVVLDDNPDVWSLTSDMSVRMRPIPAPDHIRARSTILRRGRRSSTASVDVITDDDELVASGAVGFVRVPRREADPPKPQISLNGHTAVFDGSHALTRPLREEAGIVVLDAMQGAVQMEVTPGLRNSAGTLQGAMVALLAEAAAEELASARFGIPAVVTELDLRYLAQTGASPIRTRCRWLGSGPDAPIEVDLIDTSNDRLTTLVYARTVAVPA